MYKGEKIQTLQLQVRHVLFFDGIQLSSFR